MNKIEYAKLNHRQKESYNFQKISAILAEYGYTTYRMHDDYDGADFHAVGINGEILKVQLKGRVSIDKKYFGKEIYIGFPSNSKWFLYPHDDIYKIITEHSIGAKKNRSRSIGHIPKWLQKEMDNHEI